MSENIRNLTILGGGLDGLVFANALRRAFSDSLSVNLIDQPELDVASCITLPPEAVGFFKSQDVPENLLINDHGSGYYLATEYRSLNGVGAKDFFLPFSAPGFVLQTREFHHFYIWAKKQGLNRSYDEFSLNSEAARKKKFYPPSEKKSSLLSTIKYGYVLNAKPLTDFFRASALNAGVNVIEGVYDSAVVAKDGSVESVVVTTNGGTTSVSGDFFIDCSGGQVDLFSSALGVPYLSEKESLPVDSGIRLVLNKNSEESPSYSVEAIEQGWLINTSTQNLQQIDFIYNSEFISESSAVKFIGEGLRVAPETLEKYSLAPGRRESFWRRNCLCVGKSAGNLQDFSFSNAALVQSAILRFIELFPKGKQCDEVAREYNRITDLQYDHVLDNHSLLYRLYNKDTAEFLREGGGNKISPRVERRLALFKSAGRIPFFEEDPFSQDMWVSLLLGAGVIPDNYDVLLDGISPSWIAEQMDKMVGMIDSASTRMPSFNKYLKTL